MESGYDAQRNGLADLVGISYPKVRLSDMALAPAALARLERVLDEQRRRELLAAHGFAPLRRLLFTGPIGTGKSMTASALATALPDPAQALELLRQHLVCVDTAKVCWEEIPGHARGLSHAGLARAAETAAKHAILPGEGWVSTDVLIRALGESRGPHQPTGFGRSRS